MLVSNSAQLRRLSPQEYLKSMYEDTDRQLDRYRLDDHYELQDAEKRAGHMMMSNELIARVEKVTHRRVWAETARANPNVLGFYTMEKGAKKFHGAFEKGVLPEFSIIQVDAADLPIKEKRGWRTVITKLLKGGAMSWAEVKHAFGDTDQAASERWRQNTRNFRT